MKRIVPGFIFALAACAAFSQSWTTLPSIRIPVGSAKQQVASSGEGSEAWKPIFFDVGIDGTIYIPDTYNSRIAVFKPDGSFFAGIPVTEGLSPRTNFFGLAGNGYMAIFNDGVLSCHRKDGSMLWTTLFPMFMFPEAITPLSDGVYLMVSDNTGKKFGFVTGYTAPYEMKTSDHADGIPAFPAPGGSFSYEARLTRELKSRNSKLDSEVWLRSYPSARFLASTDSDLSLWILTSGPSVTVFVLDKNGKTVSEYAINTGSISGWTWSIARAGKAGFELYLYSDQGKTIDILRYRFTER